MFSLFGFARLFLAVIMATGSTRLPIIGDVGDIIDDGIVGATVGFGISVVFYWFLISKLTEFLIFAFGGGVGRYNATKLYRRLQWLTFSLFMTLPVFVVAVLVFAATPYSENSKGYDQAVMGAALKEAQADRLKRLEKAHADRAALINRRLEDKRISLRDTLQYETESINEIFDSRNRKYRQTLKDLRSYLQSKDNNEVIHELSDFMLKNYNAFGSRYNLTRFQIDIFPYGVRNRSEDQLHVMVEGYRGLGINCESINKNPRISIEENVRASCLNLFTLVALEYNADKLYGSYADTPKIVRSLGRFLKAAIDQFSEIPEREKSIEPHTQRYLRDLENIEHGVPPLDLSKFPEISADNIAPTYILNAQSDIENPYFDRIGPNFEKHYWWLAIVAFISWVILLRMGQGRIARIYAPIRGFLDRGRMSYGGSARFATMFEEWGKSYKSGTLFVGKSLHNPYDEIGLSGEAHMLTIAGSRGGKGSSVIIPNLLLWEGSAVVIDPKGTNAHVTAQARRDMGHDVYLIDPFGVVTSEPDRFDPFDGLDPDSELVGEEIKSIADALVAPDGDKTSKDPHWDDSARTILAGLMSHVLSGPGPKKWLYQIRDLIRQLPEDQDRMWAEMSLNERAGQHAKSAAIRFIRGQNSNEILSIMSNADKHTEWLSSPIMRRITSNPTFRIRDIKKRPTTIYLIIPPRQIQRQKRLIRLFINLVIDSVEKGGKSDVPILMMIDEFLSLGRMQEFPDSFATMASYNLMLWPFVQDLGKLKEIYGSGVNSFISNSRAVQVFAVTDEETKKFVSEKLGNRPLIGLGGIARSNENVPLRSTDDIDKDISAESGRQYIITAGQSAVLAERVPYYKGARFSGKYDPDPDYS